MSFLLPLSEQAEAALVEIERRAALVVDLGPATGHDRHGEPPADPWLVVGVRGGEVFHLLRRYTEAQAREIAMAFRGVFGMPWHAARESDARRACDVPSGVIR